MPKRKNESKEEKWLRKIKRYEDKLNNQKTRSRIMYSSDEEDVQNEDHLENGSLIINPEYSEVGNMPDPVNELVTEDLVPDPPIEANTDPELTVVTDVDHDIDTEMLKVLGDLETDDTEWGDNVQSDIAQRVQLIVINGLKKDLKDDLSKKYLFPKNIPLLKAPALNPEISSMLNESSRNRDKRLCSKQEQHGRALAAMTRAMSLLLKKNPDISEVLRILNDSLKLMSDSHYLETDTRKSLIISMIDKSLVDSFKDRKRDEFLFGDKLGELVKSSRGIKKTSQLIQAPSTNNLNWKGPPARPRPQKSNQQQASRSGGYLSNTIRESAPSTSTTGSAGSSPPATATSAASPAPHLRAPVHGTPPATAATATSRDVNSQVTHAGRLRHFLNAWKYITNDKFILDTIIGYRIPFKEIPQQHPISGVTRNYSKTETVALDKEIKHLLEIKAIMKYKIV